MLTLNDGRAELWQWDTGRTLAVDADCSQVHFSNKVFGRSIDVDVADGVAIIPDILLQTDKDLNVWAFVGTAENGYTKISKTFKVNRRNKPADYVFTPTEQTTLAELVWRLDKIEEAQDPDAIKNAVEDYLEQNPVEAPVQSVNGKIGAVELTSYDVGAISLYDLQNATNAALEQAKESGEFDGAQGPSGADGITPTIGDNGNWYLGDTDTGNPSRGEAGPQGPAGADGVGIQSVVQTTTSTEDGGTNVVTVTKTDGTSSTFQVKNGSKGSTGQAGLTPNLQIGTVETLPAGSSATASMTGTAENPLLNLGIPKGADDAGGIGGLSQLATVTLTEPAASIVLNFTDVEDIIISAQFTGGLDAPTSTMIKMEGNYNGSGAGYDHYVKVNLSSSDVGYYMGYLYSQSLKMRGVLYAQTNINIAGNTTALRYRSIEGKNISSIRIFTDSTTPFGTGTTITVYGGKL